jgi:hypothetical protein
MAILRALDGKFYDLPDDTLDQYLIPADQVRSKLSGLARGTPPEVSPYGFCFGGGGWHNFWHNHWHNCWQNHWHNHWHNCY